MVVLVAPMDWGLGHATRCIPVIRTLLALSCEVLVAAEGVQKALLQREFPSIRFLELDGYNITYAGTGFATRFRLLGQLPKIFRTIRKEQQWLKNTIEREGIDIVISDNRMGLYSRSIPCIYLTHQLQIQTGFLITDKLAQKLHYSFINRFSECWIPDTASGNTLAGALSHPAVLPKTALHYLGPLSRFRKKEVDRMFDVAIILSGPEPQRTILEAIICKEVGMIKGKKITLVRGLPQENRILEGLPDFVDQCNYADAEELNSIILQSNLIISRCGYSTVMDLAVLGKKAVLIPTPGQTEQEYLARHLSSSGLFYCQEQAGFSLRSAIETGSRDTAIRSFAPATEEAGLIIAKRVRYLLGDQQ